MYNTICVGLLYFILRLFTVHLSHNVPPVLYAGCGVCWSPPPASYCTVLLSELSWPFPCSSVGTVPAGTQQPHLTNTKCIFILLLSTISNKLEY